MSGGIAYVLDETSNFDTLCNLDMVELESVWQKEDVKILMDLVQKHFDWTGSARAHQILSNWMDMRRQIREGRPVRLPQGTGEDASGRTA